MMPRRGAHGNRPAQPPGPWFESLIDRDLVPGPILRAAVRARLARLLKRLGRGGPQAQAQARRKLLAELGAAPITPAAERSNEQHYELPPELFALFLGPRLKYSSCLWPDRGDAGCESNAVRSGDDGLAKAEEAMLALTCRRAGIEDGMTVLDLGCGWGSAALWIAERYPATRVTAVSNSHLQGESIRRRAREAGLPNIAVHTADVARYDPGRRFDRIVSVEMLEHLRDYRSALDRFCTWLEPDGAFFVHVFSHRRHAYLFDETARGDWMARYFFAGGTMPSHDLLPSFAGGLPGRSDEPPAGTPSTSLRCVADWWLPGTHYARTLEAWRRRYDARHDEVREILATTYGHTGASAWQARWRLFFISCAETFGYREGTEWGVSHYLFRPRDRAGVDRPDVREGTAHRRSWEGDRDREAVDGATAPDDDADSPARDAARVGPVRRQGGDDA